MRLPKLYPILDIETLQRQHMNLQACVDDLASAGIEILQLRDKQSSPQQVLQHAEIVKKAFAGSSCLLVMNDRVDLAALAGWNAVHLGHRDLPPDAARRVFGENHLTVGVSTHTETQVRDADASSADTIAIGPVFGTTSKVDTEPVVGLEGVRRARQLTRKPLVAIGGITLENAWEVIEAGADSIAVIGAIFASKQSPGKTAQDFLQRLR